jgi:hypothetical protein
MLQILFGPPPKSPAHRARRARLRSGTGLGIRGKDDRLESFTWSRTMPSPALCAVAAKVLVSVRADLALASTLPP